MVWLEEVEVCDDEEEVEELEDIGAEEPQSSLQRGQVCRSESGNEAISSVTIIKAQNKLEVFICGPSGLQLRDNKGQRVSS